jgi:aspartate aminotransferase
MSSIDVSDYFAPTPEAHALNEESLSAKALGMQSSKILTISYAVRERIAAGAPVTQFTVGDFNPQHFNVPPELKQWAKDALDHNQTNYPPADGLLELRTAVSEHYERQFNLKYPVSSVVVGSGARPVLYAAYQCLISPGEKVLAPTPGWNNDNFTYLVDGQLHTVPSKPEDGFMPTADGLRPHLEGTRLIIICSPMNPTGTVIRQQQLEEICDLILEENARRQAEGKRLLYLIYDHVYYMLTFDGHTHLTPPQVRPEMARYTLFSDAISKCFAATGLRVGWMVGPPHIVAKVKALMTHMGAWGPRPEQLATSKLLRDPDAIQRFLNGFKAQVKERLDLLYSTFSRLKKEGLPVDVIAPEGAMYLSVKLDLLGKEGFETVNDIRTFLLEKADCAVIPFDCFGDTVNLGWMRFSVGAVSVQDVKDCMIKVERALKSLDV